MSTNNSNDWVREGTPREDWEADTDYGVEVDPAEWDDYAQEQAVPVRTPEAARDYVPPTQQEQQPEQPVEPAPVEPDEASDAPQPEDVTPTVDEAPASEARDDVPPVEEPVVDDQLVEEHPVDEHPVEEPLAEDRPVEEAREADSPVDEFRGSYETADDEHTAVRPRPIVPEVAAEQPESVTGADESRPEAAPVDEQVEARPADEPVAARPEEEPVENEPVDDDPEATAVHRVVEHDEPQPERAVHPEPEPEPQPERAAHREPEPEPAVQPEPEPRDDHAEREVAAASAPLAAGAVAAAPADGAQHDEGEYASLYREEHQKVEPEPAIEPEPEAETTQAFTPAVDDNTRVIDDERLAAEEAEERERQARLQEQRDARDARLGVVPSSQDAGVRVVTKPVKRQADKFFGAFSLFVLRGVLAAILGVLAYQVLQDVTRTEEFIANTVVPEPRLVAWILGYSLAVLAALLLIGLGARFFSVLLVLISGASLALFRWGAFSIFMDGREGFLGDRTLLTLAAALVIVAFGAGRWSIDGAIYAARQKSKESIDQ